LNALIYIVVVSKCVSLFGIYTQVITFLAPKTVQKKMEKF
jgi:hypothetical protein